MEQPKEIDIEQVIEDDEIERQIEKQIPNSNLRKALIKGARRKAEREKNIQFGVRVNSETAEALDRLSAETGLKRSTLVREILRTGLVMLGEATEEEIEDQ